MGTNNRSYFIRCVSLALGCGEIARKRLLALTSMAPSRLCGKLAHAYDFSVTQNADGMAKRKNFGHAVGNIDDDFPHSPKAPNYECEMVGLGRRQA